MFVRITEHKNKDGSVRRYLYIVESYRDKEGRPRQRVMCLGRVEELEKKGKIEELIERLIETKKDWERFKKERLNPDSGMGKYRERTFC